MENKDIKKSEIVDKKLTFLQETLNRCFQTPAITLKQLADVLAFEVDDMSDLLKQYKKSKKKEDKTNYGK